MNLNRLKRWKTVLALVGIFAAGGVAGSVITTLLVRHAVEQALKIENWPEKGMQELQRKVGLTPEQAPRIRQILVDASQSYKASFDRAFSECATNLVSSWRRIDAELTPEQRARHQAECQKFRESLRKDHQFELPPY
jgi:hypothetical protein